MSTKVTSSCKGCGSTTRAIKEDGMCATCYRAAQKAAHPEGLICTKCKSIKPATSFSNDSSRTSGKFPYCKSCQTRYMKDNAVQRVDAIPNGHVCPLCDAEIRGHANRRYCSNYCKDRVASLRKQYGLSVEQYRKLLDDSGGRCPICTKRVKKWVVEHNHETGEVTGIVCTRCNVGLLAYSDHDIETARRLVAYLEVTPAVRVLGSAPIVPDDPDGKIRGSSQLHRKWGR